MAVPFLPTAFSAGIGVVALVCYGISIVFNNTGFGALALGLTIYALH
jgi:hypothetical protein